MMMLRATLALPALLLATTAPAQDGPPPMKAITRADAIAKALERFDRLDPDHDGTVTRAEFDARRPAGGGMRPGGGGHGMGGPRWFERGDANGDGKVTRAEAETQAGAMFDRLDANHDGTVTPEERRAGMPPRGQRPAD